MTQNIRTSNGRETIRTNRLGPADDQDVRHFISSMMLTDAGHGDVLGLQRKGNALLLWVNWTRYSGNAWSRDLVRFQWGRNWSTRTPAFKIMPKYGSLQTVQAKLDPTGTYLVYRISGSGQDRYERRRVVDVESNVYACKAGIPLTKSKTTAMGWKDRHVIQGCATLGDRLWHYTSNADRTDPGALTEHSWGTGQEMARHNEPQESGLDWLGYLGARGHGDCQGRLDQGLVRNRPWEPGVSDLQADGDHRAGCSGTARLAGQRGPAGGLC